MLIFNVRKGWSKGVKEKWLLAKYFPIDKQSKVCSGSYPMLMSVFVLKAMDRMFEVL